MICSPIAKIKREANKSSEIIDEALYGTLVEILEDLEDYYYLKTFYHYEGFVKKSEVAIIKKQINHISDYNGIITKHFADILTEPDVKSPSIISLPRGAYIKIMKETINNYQAVELINRQIGFICQGNFKYRNIYNKYEYEDYLRNNIVKNALSYLGTQYRWGGKTIQGIDCSGLCHISYLLEEILIYRDSSFKDEILDQYKIRKISKDELKPADLIYMPGHVMLYIGDNKFVHSSVTTCGVTIGSLNKDDDNYIASYINKIIGYATIF